MMLTCEGGCFWNRLFRDLLRSNIEWNVFYANESYMSFFEKTSSFIEMFPTEIELVLVRISDGSLPVDRPGLNYADRFHLWFPIPNALTVGISIKKQDFHFVS